MQSGLGWLQGLNQNLQLRPASGNAWSSLAAPGLFPGQSTILIPDRLLDLRFEQ